MTTDLDAWWDELGIAWHTIDPNLDVQAPRLKAYLRRQSLLIGGAIAGCAVVGTAGLALGAFTIFQGWSLSAWNFVTRGVAIEIVAVLVLIAARTLWPVKGSDHARALAELVDLGLARSVRALWVVRLGLAACVVAAALGLAGTALRTSAGRPPAMSPIVDLALLAACAFALLLFGFRMRSELAKFAYLRRALQEA